MIDKSDMLSVLEHFSDHIDKSFFKLAKEVKIKKGEYNKIIIAGMGGSALPGDILQSYLVDLIDIPVYVHKSYDLPKFVDKDSIVFTVSYSGNTEETLSAYNVARGKSCGTVVVTSGGKLAKKAEADSKPYVKIPKGIQPRQAVGYQFFAILRVLQNSGIIKEHDKEVKELVKKLSNPAFKKRGEELATKLVDKIPVIYGSYLFRKVAQVWKIAVNENCKTTAFCNYFPELNHNEMLGFTNPRGNFHVIFLRQDNCGRKMIKRFKITRDLISKTVSTTEVVIKGKSNLVTMFTGLLMGFWTAYFLALKYGVDPTPVKMVEDLKKKL
ncbi:MAG: Bifunctional phosphoglucose/phosphomannose isomerase [Candidatus Woesearchaeota archaeon]|nr:Bifunctional phosphoglucose/phosphomannose isomerase [Candidatus Woesearchaeota archaeon]